MVENELPYIRWDEFRQMTPTILQLEVARLGTLIEAEAEATDVRNALVKARHELKRFVACVQATDRAAVASQCAPHLQAALLALSFMPPGIDASTTQTLAYVADRLAWVNTRIPLIY